MQMGLTTEELGTMYMGQFRDMFEEFKKWHNLRIRKQMFSIDEQGEAQSADALERM